MPSDNKKIRPDEAFGSSTSCRLNKILKPTEKPPFEKTGHNNPAVCMSHVFYSHEKDSFILSDLSIEIPHGSFVVLTGPNGSGKSTLALHLNGILTPDSGKVLIDGLSTEDRTSVSKIRKKVGIVFQNPYTQFVGSTVEEDVAFGPENLGYSSEKIKKCVDGALSAVGMSEFRDRNPAELSGGEAQKVAIAGVLAMDPEIIVFDEATSMLDPDSSRSVLNIVDALRKRGKTILFICHDPGSVLNADFIYVLLDGRIDFFGTSQEYILSEKYPISDMTKLLLCLRKRGYPVHIPLRSSPKEICSHIIRLFKKEV